MFTNIKNFIYEPKSKIGWVHGLLACLFAAVCSNLTMTIVTALLSGDFAQRIIPSMIFTPILVSIYGLWFLFSDSLINFLKKTFYTIILLSIFLIISLKVV